MSLASQVSALAAAVGSAVKTLTARVTALEAPTIPANTQSGTSYTLVATDAGKEVDRTNATNNAVTIDASVLPIGGMGLIRRAAAGALVVTPASGTTILPAKASVTCGAQGTALYWRCKSSTEVWVGGETA